MKNFLSIALVVREEQLYIAEFVEFHLLQGVDHFYIIEHERDSDELYNVLKSYIEEGFVTYLQCKGERQQVLRFQMILDEYGHQNEWIAFIDADEFLFPAQKDISIRDVLLHLPKDCGAYAVHWTMFGSNGHKHKTPGLVIERFTKRAKEINRHVKSIVRPDQILCVGKNPHCFYVREGSKVLCGVNTVKSLPKEYAIMDEKIPEYLRINHYHTKSELEYRKRKLLPDANSGRIHAPERVDQMFLAHDVNEVIDIAATLYAKKVKEGLARRGLLKENK